MHSIWSPRIARHLVASLIDAKTVNFFSTFYFIYVYFFIGIPADINVFPVLPPRWRSSSHSFRTSDITNHRRSEDVTITTPFHQSWLISVGAPASPVVLLLWWSLHTNCEVTGCHSSMFGFDLGGRLFFLIFLICVRLSLLTFFLCVSSLPHSDTRYQQTQCTQIWFFIYSVFISAHLSPRMACQKMTIESTIKKKGEKLTHKLAT